MPSSATTPKPTFFDTLTFLNITRIPGPTASDASSSRSARKHTCKPSSTPSIDSEAREVIFTTIRWTVASRSTSAAPSPPVSPGTKPSDSPTDAAPPPLALYESPSDTTISALETSQNCTLTFLERACLRHTVSLSLSASSPASAFVFKTGADVRVRIDASVLFARHVSVLALLMRGETATGSVLAAANTGLYAGIKTALDTHDGEEMAAGEWYGCLSSCVADKVAMVVRVARDMGLLSAEMGPADVAAQEEAFVPFANGVVRSVVLDTLDPGRLDVPALKWGRTLEDFTYYKGLEGHVVDVAEWVEQREREKEARRRERETRKRAKGWRGKESESRGRKSGGKSGKK